MDEEYPAITKKATLHQILFKADQIIARKIHLIVDNLRVHHAKLVKAWVAQRPEKIELHYQPSYSLDLNPDE